MNPKIFVFANGGDDRNVLGYALAEDGVVVGCHISSNEDWLKHDLGVSSNWHHGEYKAHYPNGYDVVFVSLEEVKAGSHAEFEAALKRYQESAK